MRPFEGADDFLPEGRGAMLAYTAAAAGTIAVAAAVVLLYWVPAAKVLCGDESTYFLAAQRLVATGHAAIDLLWPPLYPHFLAGVLTAAGGTLLAVQAVQFALLGIASLLLRDLTRTMTGSRGAGNLAAFLLLADPTMAAFATYLWPEVLHIFLFLAVLWILAHRPASPGWLVLAGISLGLALLTKSLLGPFAPLLVLPILLRAPRRQAVAAAALIVGAAALVVTPVVVANGRAHGAYVVSDSSRFNLWVGLNDRSRKSLDRDIAGEEYRRYLESAPDFPGRNRILQEKITSFLRTHRLLEVASAQLGRQYFRLFDKDSYLTDQLPGGDLYVLGSGYRSPEPWLAAATARYAYLHYGVLLVAAALGLGLVPLGGARPWSRVVLAFLAYNLLVFLLLHVKSRYRLQLVPFLDLYAGAALAALWARVSGGGHFAVGWPRVAGATALALLLLFLAFGARLLPA